jgi:protein TonB
LIAAASFAFALACAVDKPESPVAAESPHGIASRATDAIRSPQIEPTSHSYFEFQVEKPVSPPLGVQRLPYPAELKAAGITGSLIAQYVVDATGRVNVSSFKVLNDADPRFAAAVKAALATWQFEPATVGGRKVSQLVQQEFIFRK